MELDAVLLARIQFGFTVGFHYIFPPLTIGLAWLMVIMETRHYFTGVKVYEDMARFWTKLFAVTFAVGVATGIVMEFQFGTNWADYSRFVGDVFGSALAAEGIFAFFLESGFLAVLVFGWDRVSKRVHLLSTWLVALGSTLSAVWIVVANSWQQTPAGFHVVGEGAARRAEITGFWEMVFNPSAMHRLNHTIIGALILGAFFVMSISAFYILKNRHLDFAKRSFTIALVVAFLSSWGILFSGHLQAKKVAETQPVKMAAFEGHFKSDGGGAPLYLFGFPDEESRTVRGGLAIPGMLSFLIHESFTRPVPGLLDLSEDENDWPPLGMTFQTYHLMVAMGMFQIGISSLALLLLWRKRLFEQRWLLWTFVFAVVTPYVSNHAGWMAAEIGRQPWVVQGLLRTTDGVSKNVSAGQILGSILMFGFVYLMLFLVWIFVLNSKIQKGPDTGGKAGETDGMNTGFLAVAENRADPSGPSMGSVHEK
ncbi:MAG TPA: cytochrome ubiquinol oxidase subunit I [Candidatus Hydrogenedentes bacterium]|nr:cytochrome ubiquinol oxidase subunit I [Candidatus Hydrogenedentota bacterium]